MLMDIKESLLAQALFDGSLMACSSSCNLTWRTPFIPQSVIESGCDYMSIISHILTSNNLKPLLYTYGMLMCCAVLFSPLKQHKNAAWYIVVNSITLQV